MHRILLVGWLMLAGCSGIVGPVQRSLRDDVIDDPRLTPEEQSKRRRDQLALPESSPQVGPRTYADEKFR
jgi:hypothetical protein